MKNFFAKIVAFLTGLFTNLDEWIENHVQPSIELVQKIKTIVDSPFVNIINALIPGDADDKITRFVSDYLAKAIDAMYISHDIVNEPDWTLKVVKMAEYIRSLSKPMKQAFYQKLAAEIAKQSGSEESVKGHSVDLLVQLQYSKLKANIDADQIPNTFLETSQELADLYQIPADKKLLIESNGTGVVAFHQSDKPLEENPAE